ncbi:MAG TPA: thiosulfate oxidation carrier protein SoxY [Acidiferrobacterales bacterium]|nr:thiosulfate oxidation carrier protein SoxY [Acidiferrobacterales bacterium]
MTVINRRTFLKGTVAGSVLAVAASAGLLTPTRVLAAAWPAAAFDAKSVDDALKGLYGTSAAADSKAITIKAPIQAENGAVVPIAVSTSLPGVEGITILVQANERPLVASVALSGAEGYFSARMKMGKTSDVKVIVKSGGKLHMASQQIKVTVGGCGG